MGGCRSDRLGAATLSWGRLLRDQHSNERGHGSGAISAPDQAGKGAGIGAQISGFGEAANQSVATAQPLRWRADSGATALDRNIKMLPPGCRISHGAPIACRAHRVVNAREKMRRRVGVKMHR